MSNSDMRKVTSHYTSKIRVRSVEQYTDANGLTSTPIRGTLVAWSGHGITSASSNAIPTYQATSPRTPFSFGNGTLDLQWESGGGQNITLELVCIELFEEYD